MLERSRMGFLLMLELTGFPGIEVIIFLCFIYFCLLLGYYKGGDEKGRQTVVRNQLKIRQ